MIIRPVVILIFCLLFSARVSPGASMYQELADGFDYRVNQLFYLTKQEPVDSVGNPGNTLFRIPNYKAALELRPDFNIFYKNLDISVKPRLNWQWTRWEDDCCKQETEEDGDFFI